MIQFGGPDQPGEPPAQVVAVSDEHTVLTWHRRPPPLGSVVALRPGQIRTTFQRHDRVWLAEGDRHLPHPTSGRWW